MRSWLAWAAAAALLAAGCAAPAENPGDDPTSPPTDGPPGGPVAFTLADCEWLEAFAEVPTERLEPHTPDDLPLDSVGGRSLVVFGFFSCGPGGELAKRAFLAAGVKPTDDRLTDDAVMNYFWEPVHILAESELTGAFDRVGADYTRAEEVAVSIQAGHATATASGDGWRHEVVTREGATAPTSLFQNFPRYREYVPAVDGYAYFQGGFGDHPDGTEAAWPATIHTAEGTLAREIMGPATEAVALMGSPLRIGEGEVGFVAR